MNYIIIGLVLNFLLTLMLYKKNIDRVLYIHCPSLLSFSFFCANLFWIYDGVNIVDLYLTKSWWYAIPYTIFLFAWLFDIYFYYIFSNEDKKDIIDNKEEIVEKLVTETTIKMVLSYPYYILFQSSFSFNEFPIIGFIKEGWATVDVKKGWLQLQGDRNDKYYTNPLKQISHYNNSKIFIAKDKDEYFGIYATKYEVYYIKIEYIKLIDRTKM
jgi:hypothetical protein